MTTTAARLHPGLALALSRASSLRDTKRDPLQVSKDSEKFLSSPPHTLLPLLIEQTRILVYTILDLAADFFAKNSPRCHHVQLRRGGSII